MYSDISALRDLAHCPATSFHEERVATYLLQSSHALGLRPNVDRWGNVAVRYRAGDGGTPLVFVAHMDHPGFEVTGVGLDTVQARLLGGVAVQCFANRPPVRVYSGERLLAGVVAAAQQDMAAGVTDLTLELDGTPVVGDFGVWEMEDWREDGDFLRMRAADDLAGCAVALSTLREVVRLGKPGDVTVLWTRAEEVGLVGAALAARDGWIPKNAVVVSLESSRTLPGAAIGEGPVIRVGDLRTTFNHEAEAFMHDARERLLAANPEYKVQRQLMSGGTCEATVFSWEGYRATGLAFPLGNYHNVTPEQTLAPEYIHRRDFLTAVELLTTLVGAAVSPQPLAARVRYDALLATHRDRLGTSAPGFHALLP